jgi:hypothetical protein
MECGKFRYAISERTFYNYVGIGKACPPRDDGRFYLQDIELIAQASAWGRPPSFVRREQEGGEGEAGAESLELSYQVQDEKLKILRINRESAEMDLAKKRKELLPRTEYEQRLAAAAAVVGVEAENFVYDKVREIIHLCGGTPEKEDTLREWMLTEVRAWLHSFSRAADYDVNLIDDEELSDGSQPIDVDGIADDGTGDAD